MTKEYAIKLSDVSKYYKLYKTPKDRLKEALHPFGKKYHKTFYALNKVDFEIMKGEVLGVVGRNGSGKSTLLKLITGVLGASSGKVDVDGKISALLELGAGFNPEFTGLENIRFYGMILGISEEVIEYKISDIVEFADLGQFIHQPVKTYSSGMKSRLGFAVAIHVEPDILILDEILAVGDVFFKKKCYDAIHTLFNSGKTIILVSHSNNSIIDLCTRAVLLNEGELVASGMPKEIIHEYERISLASSEIGEKGKKGSAKSSQRSCAEETVKVENLEIYDLNMISSLGEKTKTMTKDELCKIQYKIKNCSEKDIESVSFGVAFKNIKGTLVGGSRDILSGPLKVGQVVHIEREFRLIFVGGGKFFVKLDVMGDVGRGCETLCLLPESLYFEVVSIESDKIHQPIGLVDFHQQTRMSVQ